MTADRILPDTRPLWRRISLRHPIRVWRRSPLHVVTNDAEVLIYDRVLTAEERQAVAAYLSAKWAPTRDREVP